MDPDQYHLVDALDEVIESDARRGGNARANDAKRHKPRRPRTATVLEGAEFREDPRDSLSADYFRQRAEVQNREKALAFDYQCRKRASEVQELADLVLQAVRRADDQDVYQAAEKRPGYAGQMHPRFMGDHFLSNADLIEQTKLFAIARKMPKGAHLHIHFNSNLPPEVLINIAKDMSCMYISCDVSLAPASSVRKLEGSEYNAFEMCKIQFHILSGPKAAEGKVAPPGHVPKSEENKRTLWLGDIFADDYPNEPEMDVDDWLQKKLVFREEEAHNLLQTVHGAWEKFNARTQMMKGLFNYVRAYEEYTRKCLEDFVDDGIQYAEIRPNFMKANQLWSNDGTEQIDNRGIMNIIRSVYEEFRTKNPDFGGLKVIYCTPRSSAREDVATALKECLQFKQEWPSWIAGFDLLGEEGEGYPLSHFAPELLQFKKDCKVAGVDIPFLFHCAETLEVGGPTDGNLLDALLLGSKRIGHGYGLDRHPYILEQMKKNNTCVELCPISNEILGLTPRASGHSMYSLLARNVHCTVSTDNGTLFRSRLSHDFYQVFAGSQDMSLHGWRQLIEWSFDHSCMEDDLKAQVRQDWEARWNDFCQWIVDTYQEDYRRHGSQAGWAIAA
ncbi:adenosine/AMP deaminase [Thozetella sp. PMI_491]|nr:adenosine/AMP deaminase [Thozetella sp. PMI_491]